MSDNTEKPDYLRPKGELRLSPARLGGGPGPRVWTDTASTNPGTCGSASPCAKGGLNLTLLPSLWDSMGKPGINRGTSASPPDPQPRGDTALVKGLSTTHPVAFCCRM